MYEFRLEGSEGVLRYHGLHMSNDTMSYEFAPVLGQFEPIAINADVFLDVWYDYVCSGPKPPFSGRNNLKVFAMLSAAVDSVNTSQSVEIVGNPRFAMAFTLHWGHLTPVEFENQWQSQRATSESGINLTPLTNSAKRGIIHARGR
jgi:hypothetical protein